MAVGRVLVIMATLQFLISTGHNAACLVQLIRGFITNGDIPNGPFLYFLNMASIEHVTQETFYITNVCDDYFQSGWLLTIGYRVSLVMQSW